MKKDLLSIVLLVSYWCLSAAPSLGQNVEATESRVEIENQGWLLIGDFRSPESTIPVPAVLMLNQAAGNRMAYAELAEALFDRGIASLRLDLRGHGESVNLGRFVPGEEPRSPMIWDSEIDVIAAIEYLKQLPELDSERIAVVGSSYSGEEMSEAGRIAGYANVYVALSPGSFSEESVTGIDDSGVPWLFVASRDERFLQEITADVQARSDAVELLIVPGAAHATDLLTDQPGLSERIAVWLTARLR